MSSAVASTAHRRFGLGPKPGDLARVASDPRGFIVAQLTDASRALLEADGLDASPAIYEQVQYAQALQKQRREQPMSEMGRTADQPMQVPPAGMASGGLGKGAAAPGGPSPTLGQLRREFYAEEAVARFARSVATDAALLERLVLFWSNHFTVSITKGPIRPLVGAFEREAIRPYVLGRFADMLKAVERHPAMLIYLDNHLSIGPGSKAGKNRARGLNENFSREILELHTLGVGGGYTQQDVTNLARLLTGWTVGGLTQGDVDPGRFRFTPNRHEPGHWTLLGRSYGGRGEASGLDALDALARHPSTARHLATKLARHFVGDGASERLIARLTKAFIDTQGDLGVVISALVNDSEAWTTPARKVVPPYDHVVQLARGFQLTAKPGELLRLAAALGQPLWAAPSPKGWPDADEAWLSPSGLRERFRIAEKISPELPKSADPRAVAVDLLGADLGAASRAAIARAESRVQGFELLMMAPEILRR